MLFEAIVVIGVLVLNLALQWAQREERRQWAQERNQLLDRVQAPNLDVYKAHQAPPKPATEAKPPREPIDVI